MGCNDVVSLRPQLGNDEMPIPGVRRRAVDQHISSHVDEPRVVRVRVTDTTSPTSETYRWPQYFLVPGADVSIRMGRRGASEKMDVVGPRAAGSVARWTNGSRPTARTGRRGTALTFRPALTH